MQSYGVVWREGARPLALGKLELLPHGIRLEGLAGVVPETREVPYADVASVRVGRHPGDRIDGHPTVILERRGGLSLAISTVARPSLVGEIAELLGSQMGRPVAAA